MTLCKHCERRIIQDPNDLWYDPEATGDDEIWRWVCDHHDTFIAEHAPGGSMTTHTLQLYVEVEAEGDLDEAEWLNRVEVLKCAVETICYDNLGDLSAIVTLDPAPANQGVADPWEGNG